MSRSGWVHVRAAGTRANRFPLDVGYAQAFTNPVWVTVGGQPVRDRAAAEYGIRWVDKLEELAGAWPGWRSPAERRHVENQFEEAREVYRGFAAQASPEAGQAGVVLERSSTDEPVAMPASCTAS